MNFEQDGAPPHNENIVRCKKIPRPQAVKQTNREKGLFPSVSRFPELTPCDFFLWSYIREKVNCELLENITDHKGNILHFFCNYFRRNISKSVQGHRKQTFVFNSPKWRSLGKYMTHKQIYDHQI